MVKKRSPVAVANGGAEQDLDSNTDGAAKKQKYDIGDLLNKVDELTETFNYELALQFAEKALSLEADNTRVLEIVGNIYAELGNAEVAKQHLIKAVRLQPNDGHVKYLYLGQLTEAMEAVSYYNKALEIMKPLMSTSNAVTSDTQSATNVSPATATTTITPREVSNVYCSLAEIYMTDCCMEENAEQMCQQCCQEALQVDGDNPEACLVMGNFLLVKGDVESAKEIAMKLYSIWETLSQSNTEDDGNDENVVELMPYESRMSLMKVLIEVDVCDKVAMIGNQLLEENEDDIRIWYYIGLSKSLMKEVDGQRHYLETAMFLYEKNKLEDEEMLSHIKELLESCPPGEEDDEIEEDDDGNNEGQKGMEVDG